MGDEIQDTNQETSSGQTVLGTQPGQSAAPDKDSLERDRDNVALALRFLVGLLALGGDEAARRLQEMQRRLDEDPTLWSAQPPPDPKSLRRQACPTVVSFISGALVSQNVAS